MRTAAPNHSLIWWRPLNHKTLRTNMDPHWALVSSCGECFVLAKVNPSWDENMLGDPFDNFFSSFTLVGSWYQEKCVCRISSYLITCIWPRGICRDSWKLNWITRCYDFLQDWSGLVLGWQFGLVGHSVHSKRCSSLTYRGHQMVLVVFAQRKCLWLFAD